MSNLTINKYKGPWNKRHAIHLLNRTLFGYKIEEINEAINLGLDLTLDRLFEESPLPSPPIHYTSDQDPNAPIGSTWVMSKLPSPNIAGLNNSRKKSLRAWQMGLLNEGGINIREKMVMFWHDHLPISGEGNARYEFQYLNLLRTYALGNFRGLMYDITTSPAMLKYLNGNENEKEAPNENYSRELLELFTIGRGAEQGDGDYTNYTEQDVLELAKSLTGWRITNKDSELPKGRFVNRFHDESEKELSNRLGNKIIKNELDDEYKTAIDAILANDEVARFLARKLHVWFIDAVITDEIETKIIGPISQIILDNNYEIKKALRTLLASEYFHDESKHGCMISSPLDFMFKVMNTLDVHLDIDLDAKYFFWDKLFRQSINLDMVILDVPSVAGWQAYYQAPQFYKYWINSATLIKREAYLKYLQNGVSISGEKYGLDYLRIIEKLSNPEDPNEMINELVEMLFSAPISSNQIVHLKRGLLGNGTDQYWTELYANYLKNPNNQTNKDAVEEKLFDLFWRFIRMPEFQLM